MITSRSLPLKIRNVSNNSPRENQNTHFTFKIFLFFSKIVPFMRCGIYGTAGQATWQYNTAHAHGLRHCGTSRKVAGSITDGVIRIFHWHNPSGRNIALGLAQPLTEMSTTIISWGGKGGRCVGLTTLPLLCADCLEIWEPQPPGTLRACPGL